MKEEAGVHIPFRTWHSSSFIPFFLLLPELWGGNPLGMEKASSLSSLLYLIKSLSSQESHIFFLLACMLCYWEVCRAEAIASLFLPAPQTPMSRRGPLLLLSVTLRHAHRWCCCCSACRAFSNTVLPTPWCPPPIPSPLLPDCYSTSVSSTVPFLKLILWLSFFRSAIFFPSPLLQLSCFLCPYLSLFLSAGFPSYSPT